MSGAAAFAFEQLKKARKAAGKTDHDGLHDFRVSLRRLITHLRAYGALLGTGDKDWKRLRRVFRATGPLRDAQVRRLWLEEHKVGADVVELPAIPDKAWRRFDKAAKKLSGKLRESGRKGRDEERFRACAGKAVKQARRRLKKRLPALESGEPEALHGARIAAKRLRYLLEPLGQPVGKVKELQTLLGDIHDLDVMAATLTTMPDAMAALMAERKDLLGKARKAAAPLG